MSRRKIDYGIDLGTTNSAIARMENGQPAIKKTDTQKDTLPSCISYSKKKTIVVGDSAFNALRSDKLKAMKDWEAEFSNTFIEFKRTMGTDKKYFSRNMERDFTSEELSSEVLKKLKSLITDEEVISIVVTVPAKFTINQKDATKRAAKLAGFEHCELLQEQIAASMAYGLDTNSSNGYWLVFDFGGGTFDAALLKVEDGIMKVIDTEGDNYLGGKNLDFAIVDEIIIPYLKENFVIENILKDDLKREILREAMKFYAEEAKIQLSFKESHSIMSDLGDIPGEDDEGNEFEIDLLINQVDIEKVLGTIFQRAINISKDLLERNNLRGDKLDSLILVGGPTYSPVLRKMLKEQVTQKVDVSVDPMTVVAKGAALYASTVDIASELVDKKRDKQKIQLSLGYESTTVEMEEFVTIKINKDATESRITSELFCEFVRGDNAWSSGKSKLSESGDVIELKLLEGKPNLFTIYLYSDTGDKILAEPESITIIQGSKVGSATLPYHIGIEAKILKLDKTGFTAVIGLEKNQSLPAKGVLNALKTQKQLRPGIKEDFIKIPIYQGEFYSEASRAIYNEHVYDIIISGEDLPKLLPEDSDVDLTFEVDRSEGMTVKAFFPVLDHTCEITVPTNNVQKEIDSAWLSTEIQKAKQQLQLLEKDSFLSSKDKIARLNTEIIQLEKLFEQGKTDYDRKKQVLNNLRNYSRQIDAIQDETEWPRNEEELKNVYYELEETFNELSGNLQNVDTSRIREIIQQYKEQIPSVLKEKNVNLAKDLIEQMRSLSFAIVDEGLGAQLEIIMLKGFQENFDTHDWSDRQRARLLINQGMQVAAQDPTKGRLRPIIMELYKLLPDVKTKPINPSEGILLGKN